MDKWDKILLSHFGLKIKVNTLFIQKQYDFITVIHTAHLCTKKYMIWNTYLIIKHIKKKCIWLICVHLSIDVYGTSTGKRLTISAYF